MAKPLDFIVAGTARSGTTAVARYISCATQFHCAVEVFKVRQNHRTLLAPDCFLDMVNPESDAFSPKMSKAQRAHIQDSVAEIRKRGASIKYFGNKLPRYYMRLDQILEEIGQPRAIVCTRDIKAIAESYNYRAQRPKDNFNAGRRGLFAVADLVLLLAALEQTQAQHVLLIPNQAILADWQKSTRTACHFVDPSAEVSFERENVMWINRKRMWDQRRKKQLNFDPKPHDKSDIMAIKTLQDAGVDAVLNANQPLALKDVQSGVSDVLHRLPDDPIAWIEDLAAQHEADAVQAFAPGWAAQARRDFPRLCR